MNSAKQKDTRLTFRNQLHFFTLTMKYQKRNVKNQYLLKLHQKNPNKQKT